MDKDRKKTDWYRILIKGIGTFVCAASAALLCYLVWIIKRSEPEFVLFVFCLIPVITFCAGCFCIYLSGYGKQKQEDTRSKEE